MFFEVGEVVTTQTCFYILYIFFFFANSHSLTLSPSFSPTLSLSRFLSPSLSPSLPLILSLIFSLTLSLSFFLILSSLPSDKRKESKKTGPHFERDYGNVKPLRTRLTAREVFPGNVTAIPTAPNAITIPTAYRTRSSDSQHGRAYGQE